MYYLLPTKAIQGSGTVVVLFFKKCSRICGLNPRLIYSQRVSKNSFLKLNYLKLVAAIFSEIFGFHQMIAKTLFKKYERCFLLHLKSYFRSRDIQIFLFPPYPLFLPVSHCLRA